MLNTLYEGNQGSQKFHDDSYSAAQFLYDGLPRDAQNALGQAPFAMNGREIPRAARPWGLSTLWQWLPKFSRTKVLLIVLWMILLWWGEVAVFSKSISNCDWEKWEQWPSKANPHHVVLLADPQLADPHTYPGRPWPLSGATIRHTDQYMRRSFIKLQTSLIPDGVFFLGDLFDGGREWATGKSQSPEKRYRKYGHKYWLKEYDRFSRIFFNNWDLGKSTNERRNEKRKLIASLPGNHDLGIGNGIQIPVRDRFNTYFGEGNRVDIVGNHTFVSIDAVSFSAKGQSQESGKEANEEIWKYTERFLSQVKDKKAAALSRELQAASGLPDIGQFEHIVVDLGDPKAQQQTVKASPNVSAEMPTILLTHVPLYRKEGTPCGPLRERHPPSPNPDGSNTPLENDVPNAIRVVGGYGYQYQNVLQPDLSRQIIEKIGSVEYVFSGDDHDYCEVVHHDFTSRGGGIREITIKSMSWAMGVRKPGFLMLSLWNPIDDRGDTLMSELAEGSAVSTTLQSHLCLLPDQLSIFIRYGLFCLSTLFVLVVRSFVLVFGAKQEKSKADDHILPLSRIPSSPYPEKRERGISISGTSSSNASESSYNLAVRPNAGKARSLSPAAGYGIPITPPSSSPGPGMDDGYRPSYDSRTFRPSVMDEEGNRFFGEKEKKVKGARGLFAVWQELKQGFFQVASVALCWYAWLAYAH